MPSVLYYDNQNRVRLCGAETEDVVCFNSAANNCLESICDSQFFFKGRTDDS